jgi:hypothetical protein
MTADILDLARLCNEQATDDRFLFDLAHPLQLIYKGGDYWYLRGTSVTGGVLMDRWRQLDADALSSDHDRCYGIVWTDDPEVALARLLELEHRRGEHRAQEKP